MVDPLGLQGDAGHLNWFSNTLSANYKSPGPGRDISTQDIHDFLFPPDTRTKAEQVSDYVNWYVDMSGLEEALNAPPYHPLHWDQDVIWLLLGGPLSKSFGADVSPMEPWGHPFLGGHHDSDPCE